MRLEEDAESDGRTIARSRAGSRSSTRRVRTSGSEPLLARACSADVRGARVVTKGGMARPDGAWVPDGRAKAIRADCEASLEALDGLPIDLYLLHAPDPRTPWTHVDPCARAAARRRARRAGRRVQRDAGAAGRGRSSWRRSPPCRSRLSVFDDTALRGGIVDRCARARDHADRPLPARRPAARGMACARAGLAEIAHEHGAHRGRGRRSPGSSGSVRTSSPWPVPAVPRRHVRWRTAASVRLDERRAEAPRSDACPCHACDGRRRDRRRDGDPGRGEVAARRRLRRTRLRRGSTVTSAVARSAGSPMHSTRRSATAHAGSCWTTRT